MPKKVLTRSQELIARGLFAIAAKHYRKVREAEQELSEFLGYDDIYCEQFSDEIYSDSPHFDKAMQSAGITVSTKRR